VEVDAKLACLASFAAGDGRTGKVVGPTSTVRASCLGLGTGLGR
jgi:hypothetical protein